MVKRTNEKLWENIKKKLLKENDNKWSARLAQQAVKEYKKRGGKYEGEKQKKDNSLSKWTNENWGYVLGDKNGRYLPLKVRKDLTPEQKKRTNKNKKIGTKKGIKNVPYDKDIKNILKKHKIF